MSANHPDVANGMSFASKDCGSWQSVWCSSPLLPSLWLQKLAADAGVHIYSKRGDLVFPLGNLIGISSKADGKLNLRLPRSGRISDYNTGNCLAESAADTILTVHRGQWITLQFEPDKEN